VRRRRGLGQRCHSQSWKPRDGHWQSNAIANGKLNLAPSPSAAGRWLEGEISPEMAASLTSDDAIRMFDSMDWFHCSGSAFDGKLRRVAGPVCSLADAVPWPATQLLRPDVNEHCCPLYVSQAMPSNAAAPGWQLLWGCGCVEETHQIPYVRGLQDRPGNPVFFSPINHAGPMLPKHGTE
jgi:hypothetical protein